MDFHLIDRVINMLSYGSPQDAMVALVTDGLTPERAHIIICAARVLINYRA